MNYQVTRVRLASVGPEPARYDPLDLDFRRPDQQAPADTVLYLPNTGGKTVLMRLLFSVLHPPIVEKIGTEETAHHKKNLLGYVLEGDTSQVAIEWRRVEGGRCCDDDVLVTGMVAEWPDRRRPAEPKPDDLKRLWYSIRGPVGLVGIERLPFDIEVPTEAGPVRRRLPMHRFKEQLTEFEKLGHRARPVVSTTSVQREWVDHLDHLGLDRALFRYQGEMNHNEAGASAIARFKEDRNFIQFFLDAVFDPTELAGLDHEFEEVADKVRRFPEYERRLRFEQAALEELEPLVDLVAARDAARSEARAARTSALSLLVAFTGAQAAARLREEHQRQRLRDQEAEMRRLTQIADRFRDEWREFRRLGAALWLKDAQARHHAATKRNTEAELDLHAWTLTEELARLNEAVAQVKVLEEAWAVQLERVQPLRLARDEAAFHLARYLTAQMVLAAHDAEAAKARAEEARARATNARREESQALVEAATVDAERKGHENRLLEVQASRDRLVTKGLLASDERTDGAHGREASRAVRAQDRLDVIGTDLSLLGRARERLDEEDRVDVAQLATVGQAHARLAEIVRRAQEERRELSTHALVIELAESETFDVELVGPGIAERLLGRAKDADDRRLGLELQAADDRRAVRGLEETGFLPPAQDIAAALARLTDAGITGAMPGTRYVADAVARSRRDAVVTNRPDLVGGIVLTERADLMKARTVLEQASMNPAMIIAVGSGAALVAAESAPVEDETFVVPPADAVWDREAAGTERARREARLDVLDSQRAELDQCAAEARGLADALVRHLATCPAGWLALRVAECDGLADELLRLERARAARDLRRQEIGAALQSLRDESTELHKIRRDAEQRASELQRLLEQETAVAGLAATIERQLAEARNWRSLADELRAAAQAADEDRELGSDAVRGHRAAGERIQQELSTITLADPVPHPAFQQAQEIAAARDDLAELRVRFFELDKQLAGETTGSEVAATRKLAIETRDKLTTLIDLHPVYVRERASVLLSAPEAGTTTGRRAAAERAQAAFTFATSSLTEASVEQREAGKEFAAIADEIQTQRRSAKIPEERMPRDRHHAALLAADARQHAEQTQSQAAGAEDQRDAARLAADQAEALSERLNGLMTQLRMSLDIPEQTDLDLPGVPMFEGSAEEANILGPSTAHRLTRATRAERDADEACRERDTAIRTLLTRDEFTDLAGSDHLYRRLRQAPAEALARDAQELVSELRACMGILQADLATLDEDRRLASTSLAKSVHKALSYLRLAESRSKMPPRLRDWSGESFLEIRFDKPPVEELDVRLRTFVIEILDPKSDRPTGTRLLMLALDRAVGAFRVKILKPNEAFAPIRVPIAELSSPRFSNGQRATVATALMLMLSEMRRQSRSAARDASVGTLILDNPLGNANAGFLIDVQRTVAAAAGIQLVYTTGIADLSALRRFSNVIALSNDAARRTMKRYVRADPALLALLVPSEEDRAGGQISARRVVSLVDDEAPGH